LEEIENQIRTSFKVTNIPVGELKKFKKLCDKEFGNVYWVGIVQLMKIKEAYESLLKLLDEPKEEKTRTFQDE